MKKPDKKKKKAVKNPYLKKGSYGRNQPNAPLSKRKVKKMSVKK